MRTLNLNLNNEDDLSIAEVTDMQKLLEKESIFEEMDEKEAEQYNDVRIICFTFEDGLIPKRDGSVGSPSQFEKAFANNDKVLTSKNANGYNIFIATIRDDLYPLGYIIMNTPEFIRENPDGLYTIFLELLEEVKT